ncbi:Dam family site-specific DNA-(adenine-N6)-methyltransferase [Candidatus Dependentiae bacterium]|nr:Dam family site-specific DNA-(adenine-N6)-methyltransferase [Candidatus Dependentiae bacterium]
MGKQLKLKKPLQPKPFLKWAGGKTQLLPELEKRLPEHIKQKKVIDCYIEPFVGGGAFFFYLYNNYQIKKAVLIDNNPEIITGYTVIKRNPEELIKKLKTIQRKYLNSDTNQRAEYFYKLRNRFNHQLKKFDFKKFNNNWITRASILIFLNKTCFNGLFRLNSKGEFNVPHGRYKKPNICNAENILAVHKSFKKVLIKYGDFTTAEKYAKPGSLIYYDPPYKPLSLTSSFTGYTKEGFNDNEQERLAEFYKKMDKLKVFQILSNSDPQNEDPENYFFEKLYKRFEIDRVLAHRMINCDAKKRGQLKEILITNYAK